MNIQQFQYVLAVAEMRHFEQAARKCFVTQSTLSTMVGKLEAEIGIKIFDRKTKPVSITKDGQVIIDQLRMIVRSINTLENKIQQLKGEMVGELQIGVIPTIAPYLLPLFLSDFARKFSKVKISVQEMKTSDIQQSLKNRNLDIGIMATPLEDAELREVPLYNEPFLLFDCFSDGPNDSEITIKNLNYEQLLLLEEGHCFRTQVQRICQLSKTAAKSSMNFEFRAGSIDSLIRFTQAHKGITLLPQMATLDLPKNAKKRLRAFSAPVPIRAVGLVVHQYFVKTNLLEELQHFIQACVAQKLAVITKGQLLKPT